MPQRQAATHHWPITLRPLHPPQVGCNDDATLENVAATGITDGNIMQVLGIIEQRIAEIVQMNELALGRLGKRQTKSKPSSIAEHAEATFLPSTLESSDDDDDDDGASPTQACAGGGGGGGGGRDSQCAWATALTGTCMLGACTPALPLSMAALKARTAHVLSSKLAVRAQSSLPTRAARMSNCDFIAHATFLAATFLAWPHRRALCSCLMQHRRAGGAAEAAEGATAVAASDARADYWYMQART